MQTERFVSNCLFNERQKNSSLRFHNCGRGKELLLLGVLLHANEALSQFTLSPPIGFCMSLSLSSRHYNIFCAPKAAAAIFIDTLARIYVFVVNCINAGILARGKSMGRGGALPEYSM
jgi:hypothetical protein